MNDLIAILKDIRPDIEFNNETNLITSGLLDSLDIIRLISEIEAVLNVSIPGEDIVPENLETIKCIEELIKKHS